jgi:UDP-N-acetylglucosamine--N-acetylmuramyl-(pentapeptide) pyrophosphoryl-undecaprenol N-acetylglucosamine transferase
MTRIVIGAGGTAGHVVPALAVADALRAEGAEVHFIGGSRLEATLVPQAGYELHQVPIVSVPRKPGPAAARAVASDVGAVVSARKIVAAIRADGAFGGGGYVSIPAGLGAASRRVPLVLGEIDSHLGLANRILKPFAKRICTTLPLPGCSGEKFIVTGRPVPPVTIDRAAARARFGIPDDAVAIVIFGGSQGARSINAAALEAFRTPFLADALPHGAADSSTAERQDPLTADFSASARNATKIHVLHAAGERDRPDLESPGNHYDLRGYIDGFMDALVAADLVIARSGGSIWEIAAAGRPSVLIPYPHATSDHQTPNAEHFVAHGAALMIPDRDLTADRLRDEVNAILTEPGRLAKMADAAATLARPNAARDIAAEILKYAR